MVTHSPTPARSFRKSPKKQYFFVATVFLFGLAMYSFVLSIASRDQRDVLGFGSSSFLHHSLAGDFFSRDAFEGRINSNEMNAYHESADEELERESEEKERREKEREFEIERLRARVQEETKRREEAEERLEEEEGKKKRETTNDNNNNRNDDDIDSGGRGGFFEKKGLTKEQWTKARDAESEDSLMKCHMIEHSEYWGAQPIG